MAAGNRISKICIVHLSINLQRQTRANRYCVMKAPNPTFSVEEARSLSLLSKGEVRLSPGRRERPADTV